MKELEILEQRRKKCPLFIYIGVAGIIVGAILFILFMGLIPSLVFVPFLLLIIPGFVFVSIGNVNFKKVEKDFKKICMEKIITDVIPGATYQENLGIPLNDIYKYNLLQKADRAYTEDLIQGVIDGVKFRTCDLRLEERRVHNNGKSTTVTYVPYFIGRFFEFDFNKNFKGNIVITEAGMIKPFGTKKISLESEEFNKKFKTFASDEYSAFYVLTPQMMVNLLDLEKANPGCIMISINSNKMCLALNNNRDTFTLKMNQPIDDRLYKSMQADLKIITDIVNELKLNDRVFKEEY